MSLIKSTKGPRVLLYDIESSLMPVAVFELIHNDYISPENILAERHLICAAWKWSDETKIHSVSLLDDPKRFKRDIHDDRHVVETLHTIMSEADVLVGHNSDSFDKRYIDTRILKLGLPALPPITSLDTYKTAKSRLLCASNKLDYLAQFLGVGKKMKTSHGLWLRVMQGDKEAIKEMEKYNKVDVEILEKVFLKLRPYMSNYVNRELYGAGVECPRCGSSDIQSRGTHKAVSRVYQRYQCQECGGWFKLQKADAGTTTKYRVL